MSLQSKLNSLITSINEITGQSKTDLTSAIQDLADNQPSGSINITENGTYDVSQKASAIVNTPTGLKIPITVSATTGSTVTCSKGSKVLTATEQSGTWSFEVDEGGTWILNATLGERSQSLDVNVVIPSYSKEITYPSADALFKAFENVTLNLELIPYEKGTVKIKAFENITLTLEEDDS